MNYLAGDGPAPRPDPKLAYGWLVRAAEAGYPDAQKLLSDEGAQREKGLTPDPGATEYWRRFVTESQALVPGMTK